MTRTLTLPVTDNSMWRETKARAHPDAGGDHELFVWLGSIEELICSDGGYSKPEPEPWPSYQSSREEPARAPYPTESGFEETTRTMLTMGCFGMPYGPVLSLLAGCYPLNHLAPEQNRGASYNRLAAIGHAWGMTMVERNCWYRMAEAIPLSDRHTGHILLRLKRRAA